MVDRGNGIAIECWTRGSGPLVVLLPSLGRGARDMDELAAPLSAAGFRTVCPEPRGNAGSTGPLEDKTLHDWAQDIAAVIEHEDCGPAFLIGHAHGNWIARTVASDRPDLVRGLMLLAGSAGKVPRGMTAAPIPPDIRASIEGSGNMDLPDAQRLAHLQRVFFAPGNDARAWLKGFNTRLMTQQTLAQKRTPVDEFFAGGHAPILNMQAEYDVVAPPSYANVLRDELGDRVTNLTIRNAAHALIPEQPEAVLHGILDYLDTRFGIKAA
ncbi:alpha/beta fold hydrolase [Pigmentiphaga litoralis]|uniref:alpha/beta fold hydrolase n=1 Tax=Pigmentiphaga litoralis TaxID=516702 RepID=UPI003B435937